MLQDRPDDRERPQEQHDRAEEIAEKKHDPDALHYKPNERVFGQNQRYAAEKKKRGPDLGGPCKEVDGARRANDQHHANYKENVPYGKKTRVEKCHDA